MHLPFLGGKQNRVPAAQTREAVCALPADFPPVFHIKLKDQVLLEGEAATLLCLPAACPAPHISWMKGKEVTSSTEQRFRQWSQGQGMLGGR